MYDYDIILGMDWLEKHWAVVDCPRKRVTFRYPDEKEFSFQCPKHQSNRMLVSALKAESLLRKGCQGYLASMVTVSDASTFKTVADVDVIKEFPDVFPDELPGLPPSREIDLRGVGKAGVYISEGTITLYCP